MIHRHTQKVQHAVYILYIITFVCERGVVRRIVKCVILIFRCHCGDGGDKESASTSAFGVARTRPDQFLFVVRL